MDLFNLSNKVAIVTGTHNGIGASIKKALELVGADVYSCGISDGIDITNENQLDDYLDNFDNVDILINNAGVTNVGWDKTYEVNLKAPYNLSQKVKEKMKNGGSIINITSINSEIAFPNNPSYVSMKHGLKGLTKALAKDYAKDNIRVNAIGPGYFKTNMTKKSWKNKRDLIASKTLLNRWGTPDDIMGLVILLSSDASSYITGQSIYVDGGWLVNGL